MKQIVVLFIIILVLVETRRRRKRREGTIDVESIVKVINNKAKLNLVSLDSGCQNDDQECVIDGVNGKCMTVTLDNMTGLYGALDMGGPAQEHVEIRDTGKFMCVKDLTYLQGQEIDRKRMNKARSLKRNSYRHKDKYPSKKLKHKQQKASRRAKKNFDSEEEKEEQEY